MKNKIQGISRISGYPPTKREET